MSDATAAAQATTPEPTHPMKPKDWVIAAQGRNPEIGRVRECYGNAKDGWVMNLVLYDADGRRIGRSSPRCGGPAHYEPAVPAEYWLRIEAPNFPLRRDATGYRDWRRGVKLIPASTERPLDRADWRKRALAHLAGLVGAAEEEVADDIDFVERHEGYLAANPEQSVEEWLYSQMPENG